MAPSQEEAYLEPLSVTATVNLRSLAGIPDHARGHGTRGWLRCLGSCCCKLPSVVKWALSGGGSSGRRSQPSPLPPAEGF